ncbi:MAG: pantoate--beta-alanine ligase [Gammaproteobacteria bacterium]
MDSITTAAAVRARIQAWRVQGSRVAFVPTMGNLHAGHLQLVEHACAGADRVVVSIFVNPMQFGPGEDYASYPRTLDRDRAALLDAGADLLFIPAVFEMYPGGVEQVTRIEVPGLNAILCGEHRPGHFNGVTTVVAKLFNMVQPDTAVFGEKDYQQLVIIRRMVSDLCMPVAVVGVGTVREADGLALSSRNQYLSAAERTLAPQLYHTLCSAKARVEAGEEDYISIESAAHEQLAQAGFDPEYVSLRCQADLAQPGPEDRELIVLAAARLGRTRLIDNVKISTS